MTGRFSMAISSFLYNVSIGTCSTTQILIFTKKVKKKQKSKQQAYLKHEKHLELASLFVKIHNDICFQGTLLSKGDKILAMRKLLTPFLQWVEGDIILFQQSESH